MLASALQALTGVLPCFAGKTLTRLDKGSVSLAPMGRWPGSALLEMDRENRQILPLSQEALVHFMVISTLFIKDSLLQCKAPKYGIFTSWAGMWPRA